MITKKRIKIPIYHGDLFIYSVSDLNEIGKKFDMIDLSDREAIAFQITGKDGYMKYYLAFEENPTNKIIAHESLHITGFIFKDRGMKMDLHNDEFQCYLLGWIVGQCDLFLNNKK